jgi:hypothetical protein
MVGAPKASGGYNIASLSRTTGTEPTRAPTTQAPTTGTATETKGGGRENNPVLRALGGADGFEGHGAQGKGLALGHLKHADKKAGKKGGEVGGAGQPTGTPQESLQKLVEDLKKFIEQMQAQKPQTQPGGTPENTGIVPPGAVKGAQPAVTPYAI